MVKMLRYLLPLLLIPTISWADWWSNGPVGSSITSGTTKLSVQGTIVGNGADTTEDTLMTYTIPAQQLKNVGDRIHIVGAGLYAATTDNKIVRVRVGGCSGNIIANPTVAATTAIRWYTDIWIAKTGSNTQTWGAGYMWSSGSNSSTAYAGTLTLTDTNSIQICVTGQNTTSSAANSIQQQYMSVDYVY